MSKRRISMTGVWRLYTRQQPVPCMKCEQEAGTAGDGACIYLGDGQGNHVLSCPHCGWRNFFDLTRSAERAAEHMTEFAGLFQAIAESVRRVFADKRAAKPKRPPTASPSSESSVFAGLDLGSLINQEVRKVQRKA